MNWLIFNLIFGMCVLMLCIIGALHMHERYHLKWWQIAVMWLVIALGFSSWLGWITAA